MHRCVAFGHGGESIAANDAFRIVRDLAKKLAVRLHIIPRQITRLSEVTDKMHGLLLDRTDALTGCVEGNPEEAELAALADVIERYERHRFHP
jgi:hypothetical protein